MSLKETDRSSGFRIVLLANLPVFYDSGALAFVPGYSGATTTDSHRLPLVRSRSGNME